MTPLPLGEVWENCPRRGGRSAEASHAPSARAMAGASNGARARRTAQAARVGISIEYGIGHRSPCLVLKKATENVLPCPAWSRTAAWQCRDMTPSRRRKCGPRRRVGLVQHRAPREGGDSAAARHYRPARGTTTGRPPEVRTRRATLSAGKRAWDSSERRSYARCTSHKLELPHTGTRPAPDAGLAQR